MTCWPVYELLRVGLISAVLWVASRVVRRLLARSPLDNIPGPPSHSWIRGNFGQLFNRRGGWDFFFELGEKYGSVVRFHGPLGRKSLYIFDPAAMSSVIVKDQDIYQKPDENIASTHLMLGDGLLATQGERHRKQRKMLNPVFSINHMREMIPTFYKISHDLRDAIASRVRQGSQELDVLDWMARTALELVGQAGLGYSFDPLIKDKADAYGEAIKAIVPTQVRVSIYRAILPIVMKIGTPSFRRRITELLPSKAIQRAREISDVLDTQSRKIFEEKKLSMKQGDEAVLRQIGEGKDILSRLMQANMAAAEEDKLPDNELLGQMSTFIFAGMDTTSGALAHTLHLLAEHPQVQEKLRTEILEAGNGQDIPYDQLVELPYLDAVCRETLRLYAPVLIVTRKARQDMIMPLSSPLRGLDGKLMHEIPVPKGTMILTGLLASNRNKALWGADAHEWKPERWLSPLPESLTNAHIPGVYSHLMTFLGGGRSCIGFKFSQLEMKVVLTVLLSAFTFSLSDKQIHWNPAGIQYPTVGKESRKPEMPMKVGFFNAI